MGGGRKGGGRDGRDERRHEEEERRRDGKKEGRRGHDKERGQVLSVPLPVRLPTLADAQALLAAAQARYSISTLLVGGPADLAGYRLLARPGGAGPPSDLPLIHRLLTRYGAQRQGLALSWRRRKGEGGHAVHCCRCRRTHGRRHVPARPPPSLAGNQVRCNNFYEPSRGTDPAKEAAVLGTDIALLASKMTADGAGITFNATARRAAAGGCSLPAAGRDVWPAQRARPPCPAWRPTSAVVPAPPSFPPPPCRTPTPCFTTPSSTPLSLHSRRACGEGLVAGRSLLSGRGPPGLPGSRCLPPCQPWPERPHLLPASQGTTTDAGWANNLQLLLVRRSFVLGGATYRVHSGFYQAYTEGFKAHLHAALRAGLTAHPGAHIIFTGHSRGAAMTAFAAVDVALNAATLGIADPQ